MTVERKIDYGKRGIKIVRETESKFAYTKDFKDLMREKKNLFSTVLELIKELEESSKGDGHEVSGQRDDITLTTMPIGLDSSEIFKLEIQGKSFFLKKKPSPTNGGFPEIISASSAKNLVKNLANVEVIQPQFAYSDNSDNHYVVSPWHEAELLTDYMHSLLDEHTSEADAKYDKLRARVNEIDYVLYDYGDVGTHNMFYDPSTDKIYLFDLHKLG